MVARRDSASSTCFRRDSASVCFGVILLILLLIDEGDELIVLLS